MLMERRNIGRVRLQLRVIPLQSFLVNFPRQLFSNGTRRNIVVSLFPIRFGAAGPLLAIIHQ